MKSEVHKAGRCLLCESRRLALAVKLTPTPPADEYLLKSELRPQKAYPLELYFCKDCYHVQLQHIVDPERLFTGYNYESSSSLGLAEHFEDYAAAVCKRYRFPPGSLAVDIGSNDGILLRAFKKRGFTVLGVDPAREIARRATASGVETWNDFFSSQLARRLRAERGPASVMTANNVFAHSESLGDMAEGVREFLADDGVFLFEVSYLSDLMEGMVFDFVYHEHLSYHAALPLQTFLKRHGLELINLERVALKGGSLRATAQKAGGPRKVAPAVGRWIARERREGLFKLQTYRNFEKRVAESGQKTLTLVKRLAAQGKKIAGYGASATTTTLIYHFGLGPHLEFIVDDNPMRGGRFSPGLHIPIYGSQVLAERKPDYLVMLAWRYARPILRRQKAFTAAGGRFIIPLPKLKIR